MATYRDVSEMVDFIRYARGAIVRGAATAHLESALMGERLAKQNAVAVFKGTPDRPKSGMLANAIHAGFEDGHMSKVRSATTNRLTPTKFPHAFVGVRTLKGNLGAKPYGRILEFGGVIRPRKAKNLWIPLFGPKTRGKVPNIQNMTPTAFMQLKRKLPGNYTVFTSRAGNTIAAYVDRPARRAGFFTRFAKGRKRGAAGRVRAPQITPLFVLKQSVKIPARPYVTPAAEAAYRELPALLSRRIAEAMGVG